MGGSGGVFSGLNKFISGDSGSEAAGNAAMAQEAEARRQYGATSDMLNNARTGFQNDINTARSQYGAATSQGIMDMDKALGMQEKNISRQEQLISQIDPTIVAASQQALSLLRGNSAPTLGPLQDQRNIQRQKLVNSLREQMGPGAETSTAGSQALNQFDQQTAGIMSNAQQSYLGTLGGTANQFNSVRPNMFGEIMGYGQLANQKFGFGAGNASFTANTGQQMANFNLGAANVLTPVGSQVINSSGSQFVGSSLMGQSNAAFGKQMFGIGAQALGYKTSDSKDSNDASTIAMAAGG